MEPWIKLEVEYARRLREASAIERRTLYAEAYSRVGSLRMASMHAEAPEHRTAGTYPALAERLASFCRPSDRVRETGCRRGYTCLKLAPHVRSIVGLDVWLVLGWRHAARTARGLCPGCGYNLKGDSDQPADKCPECGWRRNETQSA